MKTAKPGYIFAKIKDNRPVLLIELGNEGTWEPQTALYIFLDGSGACDNIRTEEAATKKRYEVMTLEEYKKLPVGAFSFLGTPK